MSLGRTRTALALAALYATAGVGAASAQYSTPVGSGAAKPKTLRATAVLEWTGTLEKPNASRLMPIAVWDGEHYQPAGLYLARPAPLAFETGTQYQLERSGEPVGLFNVRGAAELRGEWIGMGKFQAEAPPPPPPKLKVSKHLPVASGTKSDSGQSSGKEKDAAGSDRPTLHRKTDESQAGSGASPSTPGNSPNTGSSSTSGSTPASGGTSSASSASANSKNTPAASTPAAQPADSSGSKTNDADRPTLHRRTDSSDTSNNPADPKSGTPAAGGAASAGQSTTAGTTAGNSGPSPDTSSNKSSSTSTGSADPDRPTLHRHDDTTASGSAPDTDPDRPTLHKHSDTSSDAGRTEDPDRPTLHRSRSTGDTTASIDPDRPRLRYGSTDDAGGSALPKRLEGAPPAMQQILAVSDAGPIDPRPYQYHWSDPDDAAKMQSALAAIAAQAVARPHPASEKPAAQFGPAARAAARKARAAGSSSKPAAPALVDEHFAAYELSFSGGATLVYSAHTADDGPQRVYVTLIAQPDFSGKPQVLLQQIARADRLDETPSMQLVDAVDTDNDQKAELIFQLNGATTVTLGDRGSGDPAGAPDSPGSASQPASSPAQPASTVEVKERAFAIYRVANGKAVEVFNTGPLP